MIQSGAQILNGILQDQVQTPSRGHAIPLATGVHHLAAQLLRSVSSTSNSGHFPSPGTSRCSSSVANRTRSGESSMNPANQPPA